MKSLILLLQHALNFTEGNLLLLVNNAYVIKSCLFSYEISKSFKNPYFEEHLRTTASELKTILYHI